jgi:hypothetical protein
MRYSTGRQSDCEQHDDLRFEPGTSSDWNQGAGAGSAFSGGADRAGWVSVPIVTTATIAASDEDADHFGHAFLLVTRYSITS